MSRLDQGMPHTPSDYLDNSTKREATATLGDDTAKIPDFRSGSSVCENAEADMILPCFGGRV